MDSWSGIGVCDGYVVFEMEFLGSVDGRCSVVIFSLSVRDGVRGGGGVLAQLREKGEGGKGDGGKREGEGRGREGRGGREREGRERVLAQLREEGREGEGGRAGRGKGEREEGRWREGRRSLLNCRREG